MPHFNPGWKMTMFTFAFSPLLFWLGHWQLDREQEKIAMQEEFDLRSIETPTPIDEMNWESFDLAYHQVSATGTFENEHTFLLDNRTYQGHVGYEVLTPFLTAAGARVLINRGWIAQGATRELLPDVAVIPGEISVNGTIYVPLDEPFLLSDREEKRGVTWPLVIQSIDMSAIADNLEAAVLPYSVRLQLGSPGLEQSNWPIVNMSPETHRAYAVQWFAMLIALITMYLYFGFRHPGDLENREIS